MLDKAKFAASFAADVEPEAAEFMANSQVPWGLDALSGAVTEPAWKTKPSWYLVATDDKMIPPTAQRFMSKRAGATVARPRAVTRSTCRSPIRWQRSSRRPPRRSRRPGTKDQRRRAPPVGLAAELRDAFAYFSRIRSFHSLLPLADFGNSSRREARRHDRDAFNPGQSAQPWENSLRTASHRASAV